MAERHGCVRRICGGGENHLEVSVTHLTTLMALQQLQYICVCQQSLTKKRFEFYSPNWPPGHRASPLVYPPCPSPLFHIQHRHKSLQALPRFSHFLTDSGLFWKSDCILGQAIRAAFSRLFSRAEALLGNTQGRNEMEVSTNTK